MPRTALVLLAGLVFVNFATADPPKADSLREFVLRNKTRHAVGLYLQNKKVGYMVVDLDLGKRNGEEVAVETSEMLLSLSVDGEKTTSRQKETVYYSLRGDGPIIFAEQIGTHDNKETIHTAVPSAKGMTITTKIGKDGSKREVPLPKSNVLQARRMIDWLSGDRRKGDTFEHWGVEWDEEEIDSKETFTYLGKSSILWGGVRTDVHQVKINMKGAIFEADVLANGNPIRGKVGGLLEMKAETEDVAKRLDKGDVDMIAASSIKVDQNLGLSPTITGLTLEVIGLKEFSLPESHRQRIRRKDGKVFLDLKADYKVEKPAPLTDEDRKKYTSATPAIQSDNGKVKKLAAEIVGDETDPLKKAEKIKSWVYKKVRKTMANNSSTTLGVMDCMAGDCTEHTLLFVALARAAGVPARELTGVAHIEQMFGWHAWAEVHDGHQWVSVDPTWNELYVDATHIVFSNDAQDHSWLNVLGNVSFRAVKVERKKK